FDIRKGWFDPHEQKWIQPGELINCFPASARIDFAHDVRVGYRRWYSGEATEIVTASGKTLRGTPNHPVLTQRGWIALNQLETSDHIVEIADKIIGVQSKDHINHAPPVIAEIFDALLNSGMREIGIGGDFHGDRTEGNVDIVRAARPLSFGGIAEAVKRIEQLRFSSSNHSALRLCLSDKLALACLFSASRRMSASCEDGSAFRAFPFHSEAVGVAGIAGDCSDFNKPPIDGDARDTLRLCQGEDALSRDVTLMQFTRVVSIKQVPLIGHVFNLETKSGWYTANGIVSSNCRCTCRPVFRGVPIGT